MAVRGGRGGGAYGSNTDRVELIKAPILAAMDPGGGGVEDCCHI